MTLYPRAEWRPLDDTQPARMARHDLVILHTMVGSLDGTDGYFRQQGYGGTESHFGVGGGGKVYQWVDLECRADANLEANDTAISIETADKNEPQFPAWGGTDVPAWTPEQIEAIAQIVAWCCDRWDIPCQLVPDSKPGRRGVGYHRQGIDPWRVSGGEEWSTSYGKVCPGDRRVAQVQQVIERARAIGAGDSEDDMSAEAERQIGELYNHLLGKNPATGKPWGIGPGQSTVGGTIAASLQNIQAVFNQGAVTSGNVDDIESMVQAAIEGLPPGAGADEIAKAVAAKFGELLTQEG